MILEKWNVEIFLNNNALLVLQVLLILEVSKLAKNCAK